MRDTQTIVELERLHTHWYIALTHSTEQGTHSSRTLAKHKQDEERNKIPDPNREESQPRMGVKVKHQLQSQVKTQSSHKNSKIQKQTKPLQLPSHRKAKTNPTQEHSEQLYA